LDLKAQFATLKEELMPVVSEVFAEQGFILGPRVAKMEEEFASYLGVKHAVGVSSGSDALILSLMALGIGPGDGVITTPFTFFATAGAVVRLGAMPLFADIDPDTYNLDPQQVARLLERQDLPAPAKALIPVHLFGQPVDMAPLMELAQNHGLYVIEDAAQAIGAAYPDPAGGSSLQVGAMGHTGCFSFFPSKNLGAAGDGGLITCMDDDLGAKIRSMRTHGSHPQEKYRHLYVGGNFRLDSLQGAVLSVKLRHLEEWSAARRKNAAEYNRLFAESGLVEKGLVGTPKRVWPDLEQSHIYNQYVIRAQDRDGLMAALKEAGIGFAVYYPTPMHLLECFAFLGGRPGDFPVAEKASQEVLALPVYPELTPEQQQRVVQVIQDFYA
jgi:dTDP-4-amino-4,6-dideoxygalactose transaminase